MLKKIRDNLKELGFKTNEIKVYISLTKMGEATASQVAKRADIPRTTAIGILEKLKKENYLTANRYRGATYWIEAPHILVDLYQNKIEIAKDLNIILSDLYRENASFPFTKVFDTRSGIKHFIEKTLTALKKNSIIYTIDSPNRGNYTKIYSENIESTISKQKKKKGIVTYTLIPFGSFQNIAKHKLESQDIIIREMPEKIKFCSSLWIIDDMIVHFSGNPPFLTVTKHEAIVAGMKNIYDFIWSVSPERK